MTAREHYIEAEKQLRRAEVADDAGVVYHHAAAQVHATLALAGVALEADDRRMDETPA